MVLVTNGQAAGPPRVNSRAGFTRSLTHPIVVWDEIRAAIIRVSARREVLLDLFYHCRNVLCTGIPSLIGLSRDGGFSSADHESL